jgi:hypothetical protein
MSVTELEKAIARLPEKDFSILAKWFEEYRADKWDRQIEADAASGKLDQLLKKADEAIDAGLSTPL